ARKADRVRGRPARSRFPLCDRRFENPVRAWLAPLRDPGGGARADGRLVSRQRALVARARGARRRRAAPRLAGMTLRLLVFGRTGQVATELQRLAGPAVTVTALGRDEADL